MKQSNDTVGAAYKALRALVQDQPVVHTDDTGWRVGGGAAFLMAFVNPWLSCPSFCGSAAAGRQRCASRGCIFNLPWAASSFRPLAHRGISILRMRRLRGNSRI